MFMPTFSFIMEKTYESPVMEVVWVIVEKGFAGSDSGNQLPNWDII